MARQILKCFECKQNFRREELINYTPLNSNTAHNYCSKCLKEKQAREQFSNKICSIFGLKNPGPRIWTERKRLQEKYGYTDNIIIECLDYIYNVEHAKKLTESLCLVTPVTVEKMKRYKRNEEYNSQKIINAMQITMQSHIVPIKENEQYNDDTINLEEWLND